MTIEQQVGRFELADGLLESNFSITSLMFFSRSR